MSRYMRLILIAGLSLLLLNCPSQPKPPETVAAPTFSPVGGAFVTPPSVTIATATEGAEIRYTTDGSTPSATVGSVYSAPVQIPQGGATLKAIAVKDKVESAVVAATYTITGTVASVTFSPAAGSYEASVSVTMSSATSGATIRYTTDGSEPSATAGKVYSGPVKLEATTQAVTIVVKAIATKTDWAPSKVASATYVVTPKVAVVAPPTAAPVTDEEIAAARGALARAREFDAQIYDPDNLAAANNSLAQALQLRTTDPDKAHAALAASIASANLAYENSVQREAVDLSARMEKAKQALLSIKADEWLPADYQGATGMIDTASSLYASGDYAGSRSQAYEALRAMTDLYGRLDDRLAYVRGLKAETETYMAEAENTDAYRWAPEQKDKVTTLYVQGLDAWAAYELDGAEESFGAARAAARDTLTIAEQRRSATEAADKQSADQLQVQAKQAIEDAAGLTVASDTGEVVTPDEWTQFLKDIQQLEQQYPEPQSALPPGGGRALAVAIPAEGTVVLAEQISSIKDLLTEAKNAYQLGLEARSKGDYQAASDYFNEALRYVQIYKSFAVKGVYTVRLIPERRDCLWRIAEYSYIYNDPWRWPLIWRRNRNLIQNPDLIYPGWQLVIPLLE
jgi:nucleoid-associated protein YgaU